MINTIKRSILRKFMLAVLATTCSALLVAGVAMLMLNIKNFKTAWVKDLTTQSDILIQVTAGALKSNDRSAAAESLAHLKARPTVLAAAIYDQDGKLFATYSRAQANQASIRVAPASVAPGADGHSIKGNAITLVKRIERNGKTLGTVYMYGEYPLAERVQGYGAILLVVMIVSLIVAMLVSTWLQAAVTTPIMALTAAAKRVIRQRDFSERVEKTTEDEVGLLVDAFNSLLAQVGEHATALESSNAALQSAMQQRILAQEALQQLNNTLEERIALRSEELQSVHEQLRQSQKLEAIGQLTGGVAHDFNNVLQVIIGNLQLLQMNIAPNPETQRWLEAAAFAADRGAKLAAQLLAFARRQPLQPLATNLGRVLRRMDDLLRRVLGESIEVETVVAGGLWMSLVDPHQLENVILTLSINARDAMKGEGKLTLELGNAMLDDQYVSGKLDVPKGQYVMLAISDTGAGMSPEVMTRAFEPFFTTKREGEGTGLGLSMAYGFVKQSNGHIKLYSEVGSGTTIKIYLPRAHQVEEQLSESLSGPVVGGSETILVVEDDLAVQVTAVDILAGLGYRVLRANDGQSALNILQSGAAVDFLFTDVVMPGPLRSPDLAKQAKLLLPDIAILFTSGYTQNAIVHGGRLDPGVELISKPYRREDLARKIRSMLNNRQINRQINQKIAAKVRQNMAEQNTPAAQHDASTAEPLFTPMRILVVEDHADSQKITCELLSILGHSPQGVATAEQALNLLNTSTFDVVLTDINLPGMSGVELARHIARDFPALKIIFSSGYGAISSDILKFEYFSLPKPFNLMELQNLLNSFIST